MLRSLSRTYGKMCGTVVLGACGFVQWFMFFSVGRSFASKVNALSVYFCRKVCQVVSNFCTWGMQMPSIMQLKPKRLPKAVLISIATWIHLFNTSARSSSSEHVRMVTATNNRIHSVRSTKSLRNCSPWLNAINSMPLQSKTFVSSVRCCCVLSTSPKINCMSTRVMWFAIIRGAVSLNIIRNVFNAPLSSGLFSIAGSSSVW